MTTKSVEEMAEEYCAESGWLEDDYVWREIEAGFRAGYKAAKDNFLAKFQSLLFSYAETSFNPNHTAWQIFDALNKNRVAKDRVADASNVIIQWISVSDRLPPGNTKGWFVVLLDHLGCLKTIGSSQYINGDWLQIREGLVAVTHWAEMPKELP